jgi:hypothetical protein
MNRQRRGGARSAPSQPPIFTGDSYFHKSYSFSSRLEQPAPQKTRRQRTSRVSILVETALGIAANELTGAAM